MRKKVIAKSDNGIVTKGRTYWIDQSEFCGHCYHVFVCEWETGDDWLFNIFNEEKFRATFEEC